MLLAHESEDFDRSGGILPRAEKQSTGLFFAAVAAALFESRPSNTIPKKKRTPRRVLFLFGRSGGIRTHGLLDPNGSKDLRCPISGPFRPSPPVQRCSLPVLSPSIPLSYFREIVKTVVKSWCGGQPAGFILDCHLRWGDFGGCALMPFPCHGV